MSERMNPSTRIKDFKTAAVHEMLARGQKEQASGKDVIYLVQGEPDFSTPSIIHEEILKAAQAGNTHYTPPSGLRALRQRLAEYVRITNNIPVTDGDEIIVTTGATQGLFIALLALVEDGDNVLLLEPGYISTYSKMVKIAGGSVKIIACPFDENRYPLDVKTIEKEINTNTKAIIINTPVNPTGTVYSKPELEALAELVLRYEIIVISDEAYETLIFDPAEHISIASIDHEIFKRTITIFTCSKTYAMTGWRIGYNVAAPELVKWMTAIQTVSARCAAAPVQYGLMAALDGKAKSEVENMVAEYADRRSLVIDELSRFPNIVVPKIEGAFYAFPGFGNRFNSSYELALRLLEEQQVITTPGSYYGVTGENHLRLSFSYNKARVAEGLNRMRIFWDKYAS